jgi:hypothetical protein
MESVIQSKDCDRTLAFDMARHSWIVIVRGQQYVLGEGPGQSNIAALPFLEMPLDEVQRQVSQFQKEKSAAAFPFEWLVRAGFDHGSPHWTDCALRWLSGLQPLHSVFRGHLERIVGNSKRYNQQTRQLAHRLLHGASHS